MGKIICRCGEMIFDGLILKKVSVAQFGLGRVNIKCKTCKYWMNGLSYGYLTGEISDTADFRERRNNGKRSLVESCKEHS